MNDASARHFGKALRRLEDPPLLRGIGCFVDDLKVDGALHVAFARSSHAHARIVSIHKEAARNYPGVVAVFSDHDLAIVLKRKRMPLGFTPEKLPADVTPWVLAGQEVCFVGEPIAMVVAHSRYVAEDAATLIQIEYVTLPALTDCRKALDPAAPLFRSTASQNVLKRFEISYGDVHAVFQQAPHTFRINLWQHRGAAHPIEGRGIIVRPDPVTDSMVVWSSTQMPHELASTLTQMLGFSERSLRVITPDVGGGFGAKFLVYPEEVAVAAAARILQRPVKWIEDRREHFISAIQERDQYWDIEIAVDANARILGVRGQLIHDQGAYTPQGLNLPYNSATSVTGPYHVPAYKLDVFVAQTNKVYAIPVRGAGYPEAAFTMERLLDRVARELNLDRAEVRRRNLILADEMPYAKPLLARSGAKMVMDSGNYPESQEELLGAADYWNFPARQDEARREKRYVGIGLAHGVKGTGRGPFESGLVRVATSGRVSVFTGALAMGQGTKTTLAQICADQLGVSIDDVDVVAGDTGHISLGLGGFASRQAVTAGSSVHLAAKAVRAKALKVASRVLEADEGDLELADGNVHVAGAKDVSISLAKIAQALRGVPGYSLPTDVEAGLEANVAFRNDSLAYAHSLHVCEVEVDIWTGRVKILRYLALQDSGRLINPLIVEGQVHGGVVHGIGNALFEFMGYDEGGQPYTSTFAEYLLPIATDVPNIEIHFRESPSPYNPLGVKGVGEGGTVPVAPAIISAVEDALLPFNITISRTPITPVYIAELLRNSPAAQAVIGGS
jgi:aerobic carbon-monoxide dehydrogenase large subunit